jgi:hypothetical protein
MSDASSVLGIAGGPPNIFTSIDTFSQANMSPSDIFSLGNSIPQTVGGIPGIGSRIPSLAKIPIPGVQKLVDTLAPINNAKFGVTGSYESIHYADDLNKHYPKFKFLFKVKFVGFPGQDFEYYVHRCDKPKVRFNHTDVNYYNFRTRVLTSVIYEPLQLTFLDEVGNSVFNFFLAYLRQTSGTGQGNYGIDKGWGDASSSVPYANGYAYTNGQKIILEQIFVNPVSNGPQSNRFTFINPRIEMFDYDELSHEDSASGSNATITFSYDAIDAETQQDDTLYSWGITDLFRAGGTSGVPNASAVDGASMYSNGSGPPLKKPTLGIYDALRKGSDILAHIPNALNNLISPILAGPASAIGKLNSTIGSGLNSGIDVLSSNISGTLGSITSGSNLVNQGSAAIQDQTVTLPAVLSVTDFGSNNGLV